MAKIYIDYNHLCDWKSKLVFHYDKLIGNEVNIEDIIDVEISDLWKHFPFPNYTLIEDTVDHDGNEMVEGLLNTSVEVDEDNQSPNVEYFKQFLYDNMIEVVGHAGEKMKGLILRLNKLIREGNEVIVHSSLKGRGRSSALIFLGSNIYEGNVIFHDDISELDNTATFYTEKDLEDLINNG